LNLTTLNEATRQQLINKGKTGQPEKMDGKTRYEKRVNSKISSTVKQYNSIDMNKAFKDNILTVDVKVRGETDDYEVKMSFGGFLDILHDQVEKNGKLDLRGILKALMLGFNKDNVYISCTCPDFHFRMSYWATRNQIISGPKQTIPSPITNPNDKLGPGCKHVMLVLNNSSWIIKTASVFNNYINYIKDHYPKKYADIIYPAIYKKPYQEPVQMTIDDTDDLVTDKDTLDIANKYGKERTQFKKGNVQGIRFSKEDNDIDDDQILFDET
jgi:hypothetical protein